MLDSLKNLFAQQAPPARSTTASAAEAAPVPSAPAAESVPKRPSPVIAKLPKIGITEALCPHCGVVLEKMPGRKKKCPHCGEFIYVRTRPQDRAKVLVTESQAQEIEAQWDAHHSHQSLSKYDDPGLTPDEQWGQCNKRLLEYAKAGEWGLYRNTRLHMANIVHREGRLQLALQTYLEVCYLDLNGPSNVSGLQAHPDLLKEFPPFRPDEAFLAPGVVAWVLQVAQQLALDERGVKSEFLEAATRVHSAMRLPVTPERAWPDLWKALSETQA